MRYFIWLALLLAFVASSSAIPTSPRPNVHVVDGSIGSILYRSTLNAPTLDEYFTYDALGSTVSLTLNDGSVESSDLYEAFGSVVSTWGTSVNNRLSHTKERDLSLGLDNHGMRYYDPVIGRYITRDPLGYGDGMNVYLYVHDNPINHIDPLGLGPWSDMVDSYVNDVEQFYFRGANNVGTQAAAAGLMTGVRALTGLLTAGDKLADQFGTVGGQASVGEFHKENIPIAGPLGTHIGQATWNAYEHPSVETMSDVVASYAGGAELALGGVQTYRSMGGPGSFQQLPQAQMMNASPESTFGSIQKRLLAGKDVAIEPGTKALRRTMADTSKETGNEVALLRMKDGSRVLRMGDDNSVSAAGAKRVIAHTHNDPNRWYELSKADIKVINNVNNKAKSTVIVNTETAEAVRVPVP